jgi:hypothetical protein
MRVPAAAHAGGGDVMTPDMFAPYDFLNCAATAVDEDGCERRAEALAAWQAACSAAKGLFPEGSDAAEAVSVILAASRPPCGELGAAELWDALDAASYAALIAMTGDGPQTAVPLNDLEAAIAPLTGELRDAMQVIAGEIAAMAMTQVPA